MFRYFLPGRHWFSFMKSKNFLQIQKIIHLSAFISVFYFLSMPCGDVTCEQFESWLPKRLSLLSSFIRKSSWDNDNKQTSTCWTGWMWLFHSEIWEAVGSNMYSGDGRHVLTSERFKCSIARQKMARPAFVEAGAVLCLDLGATGP